MAHEIEKHDGLVLHKHAAWHGLGTVVEDAPTPREALKIAGLDWGVVQYPMVAIKDAGDPLTGRAPQGVNVPGYRANYRSDCDVMLGMVSDNYVPIQNAELADFCEALAEQGDTVKVESAGSIRNGQKLWFLLKGESFSVRRDDEVIPYYCISNGHDGLTALRCTPTTVRVVCSNTLHMVIPRSEGVKAVKKNMGQAVFTAHHTRLIKQRVEEAKAALGLYGKALDATREAMDHLGNKEINQAVAQEFLARAYTKDFGDVPANPKDKKEMDAEWKFKQAYMEIMNRFEAERQLAGNTMWNIFNAYTGWLQNDRVVNINDVTRANESRMSSKLFGVDAERAHSALNLALVLAG
jgi:phage/plasmid-like protein (TIGR03299 family)